MTIDCTHLQRANEAEWAAWLSSQAGATFYHTLIWRDFVTAVFGHRACYLVARRGERLVGALPLFEIAAPFLGRKLISLPYDIESGGALADGDDVEAALASGALALARERRVRYLELRSGRPRPVLEQLGFRTQQPVLISEMSLTNADSVRAGVAADHRKAVRKAAARGIHVRLAESPADYAAFHAVYLRVFRDFGTPPYAKQYFSGLYERLHHTGHVQIILAELNGRAVGALLLFRYQQSLVSKFAVCLPEAVPLRAYAALYWRAIEFGLDHGYRTLSWGTSSRAQTGLIEFKERWGATTRPAILYDFDVRGRAPDLEKYYDSEGLAQRVWRRLPLSATRVAGGWLNRWFC